MSGSQCKKSTRQNHRPSESIAIAFIWHCCDHWNLSSISDHELHLQGYNFYRKDRQGKRGGGVLLAVKSHLTCLRRRDLETEVEMLACVIYTSLSLCFVFCYRCFIVLLSLMSSFLSSSRNSYKDIHPQNCLISFCWAILIFHKPTGLMAYKFINLYFYLYLYNRNIRKSDDWNLHRPSKR